MTNTDAPRDRYNRVVPEGCKSVKLSATNAWRTTYTHIVPGDRVMMMDRDESARRTQDRGGRLLTAAPTAHPKRAMWLTVERVERTGGLVTLIMAKDWGSSTEAAHTAVTRQERAADATAQRAADREPRYAVDYDTRMLLATRAMSIGYTTEGAAQLMDDAYYISTAPYGDECGTHPAMRRYSDGDCKACDTERQAAEREAAERVASDGTRIRLGSRVTVLADWTDNGVPLAGIVVHVDPSAVWVEHAEGCAPLAYGAEQLAAYTELVEIPVSVPVRVPGSEAQRRAIRAIGYANNPVKVHASTVATLIRDGWMVKGTTAAANTLTEGARAWLDSEHTAEVRTLVVKGATLYSALCNCGREQENPRLRGIPWESAGCLTAEDAVAVALGHGAVSRPQGHTRAEAPIAAGQPETSVDDARVTAPTGDTDAAVAALVAALPAVEVAGELPRATGGSVWVASRGRRKASLSGRKGRH